MMKTCLIATSNLLLCTILLLCQVGQYLSHASNLTSSAINLTDYHSSSGPHSWQRLSHVHELHNEEVVILITSSASKNEVYMWER